MIRLFCGHDEREAIGYAVFTHSVLRHASESVAFTPLTSRGMPVGSNEFTYSRFLVPYLCNFTGHAIFCDASDMLMLGDVAELDALFDPQHAVQVVQRPNYKTRHPIKYVGTSMQCPNLSYARKNWTSVMLMNCEHPLWGMITPELLPRIAALSILQLGGWTTEPTKGKPAEIGALPDEWNRLADEGDPVEGAKILHWTAGIPAFPHYKATPGAEHWHAERARMLEIAWKTFIVRRGERKKTVQARDPLAACKKAFRAPPMTRWESVGDEGPSSALVFHGRTPVAICNLYDNGTGGQP